MSEMIDKVARALCEQHYCARFGKLSDDPHVRFNVNGNWWSFQDQARTAIEAMREPTDAMAEFAEDNFDRDCDDIKVCHRAFIHAALSQANSTTTNSHSPATASESLSIPGSSQPQGKEDAGGDSVERHAPTNSQEQKP